MTNRDGDSFRAGQDLGTRISATVARLAALQLVEDSRWWNRWRRRLMARALIACADELEDEADAQRAGAGSRRSEPASAGPGMAASRA